MRLTELWKSKEKPTLSFEVYPARTAKAAVSFEKALNTLCEIKPDFFSVTFGAGGSTRKGSSELIRKLVEDLNQDVLAYVACYGLAPDVLDAVIEEYQEVGVETILTVRGDEPRDQEGFVPHPDSFAHATDFMKHVKSRHDLCVGAACYPEGHIEAESKEKDLEYARQKADLGAEFLVANYFYDNRYYFDFVDRCRADSIEVPILPGVMPIFSIKMMNTLAELCGATIPDDLHSRLSDLPEDDKSALVDFGIDYSYSQCRELLAAGVPGVHIYTMDRSKSAKELVRRLRADNLL